jgi:hypothetical protein
MREQAIASGLSCSRTRERAEAPRTIRALTGAATTEGMTHA